MTEKIAENSNISHYRTLKKLGAGGMGEVYLAQDTKLDRKVALKILPTEFAENSDRMSRFVREAKSASALNHPNIITIHEIGEIDSTHFIATEYIEGETLHTNLKNQSLNFKAVLEIAIQIVSALDAAHRAGIIHRDIKPENVMIRPDGLIKILDFGIAKLSEKGSAVVSGGEEATAILPPSTSPGMIIGTANYMSPEQAKGKEVDARSDIFSFGILLYEMLTGKRAFEGENALEVISSILKDEPKPLHQLLPEVPTELERIVGKTLRKDRDERYQTARDLLIDLKDAKQNLEFQDKLEQTITPEREEPKTQLLQATTLDEINHTTANRTFSNNLKTKYLWIGLTILLLSATGFFIYRYFTPNSKQIESIAVLPFENASGNSDLDYLSDGVSESIIDRLSQLPQLKVIARSSSFKYRGQNSDLKQIADGLGVDAIVMGRVVPRGDSYQIRVDVTDVRENKQIWGENFTRKTSDVQLLQTDISREIAENLLARLSGTQSQQLAKQGTTNPQAYELLLKGRFYFNKGGGQRGENFRKAVEYYEQAVAADPNYALAHAELSDAYSIGGGGVLDRKQRDIRQEAAARKALELDPNLADAHFAMAQSKRDRGEWAEAEREYKRAAELNPNLAKIYSAYAYYLHIMKRPDEAVAAIRRALELDPLSIVINVNAINIYYLARRYDEAIAAARKAFELEPNNSVGRSRLGNVYEMKGMYAEALAEYREVLRLRGGTSGEGPNFARVYAKMGERAKAEEILQKFKASENNVEGRDFALVYDALGRRDEAFAELEKDYAENGSNLTGISTNPLYDNLRSDPRFADLLRRMGLPQQR